ncbi:collagen-like protein [Salegentibacter sp. F14]
MKKLLSALFITALLFTSCEGDQGPPGPPGADGEPGVNVVGQTLEYEDVDFDYFGDVNYHSTIISLPEDVEVLTSDAILVYRLEVIEDNGDVYETWSLIPQNFFLDQGTIQYVYNHTDVDVELIIDGNFDLSNLDAGFTQDQVFRFVIVPSDFAETTGIDVANFNAVINALDLQEQDVEKIQM